MALKYLYALNAIKTTARKKVSGSNYVYAYVVPSSYKKINAETLRGIIDSRRNSYTTSFSLSLAGLSSSTEYVVSTEPITETSGGKYTRYVEYFDSALRFSTDAHQVATGVTGNNTYYDVEDWIYTCCNIEIYGTQSGFHTVGEKTFYFYPVTKWSAY